MMSRNIAMSMAGFAAMALDFVIVASIFGLLLLRHWIGLGWDLDLLTVLSLSYVAVAWLFGKRFVQFLNQLENRNPYPVAARSPIPVVAVRTIRR
jgi:membrane protein implicated in regulation of membrane protease activity